MSLPMTHFLAAVQEHGLLAVEQLVAEGYPFKVIERKAEKADSRGYVEYGTTPVRCWLTDAGRAFLAHNAQ